MYIEFLDCCKKTFISIHLFYIGLPWAYLDILKVSDYKKSIQLQQQDAEFAMQKNVSFIISDLKLVFFI